MLTLGSSGAAVRNVDIGRVIHRDGLRREELFLVELDELEFWKVLEILES